MMRAALRDCWVAMDTLLPLTALDHLSVIAHMFRIGGLGSEIFRPQEEDALPVACGFHRIGGFLTHVMNAAMDIGVFGLVRPLDGLDHGTRFLCACRAVKIDQRLVVDLLAQNRKILANPRDIECAAKRRGIRFARHR